MTSSAKKYSIVTAVLLLAAVSTYIYAYTQRPALAQNITSTINTARYILFGGAYQISDAGSSTNAVFKLDTYTGDTWMLISKKDSKDRIINTWLPIDNPTQKQLVIPAEQPQINELDDMRNN